MFLLYYFFSFNAQTLVYAPTSVSFIDAVQDNCVALESVSPVDVCARHGGLTAKSSRGL